MVILAWLLGDVARWFADGLVVNAQLYFHAFRIDNVRSPWMSLAAAIGMMLAWWHASDLGYALTFGCVAPPDSGAGPCLPSPVPWDIVAPVVLMTLSGSIAWDASGLGRHRER
jgi:hypothetical protein